MYVSALRRFIEAMGESWKHVPYSPMEPCALRNSIRSLRGNPSTGLGPLRLVVSQRLCRSHRSGWCERAAATARSDRQLDRSVRPA